MANQGKGGGYIDKGRAAKKQQCRLGQGPGSISRANTSQYLWALYRTMCLVTQSCLTLCNPMDCSPPGSSVHGILLARLLEWVTISSSRKSSQPRDRTCVSGISCIGRQVLHYCTSPQTLSLRFNLALVDKGWVFSLRHSLEMLWVQFHTTTIKQVTWSFCFPSTYKRCVYATL